MGEIGGNYGIDLTFSDLIFFVTNSSLLYLLVHDLVMFFHQKYSCFFSSKYNSNLSFFNLLTKTRIFSTAISTDENPKFGEEKISLGWAADIDFTV